MTVQLPLYNERCVVERLLDAVGALDYPADRLEIQVLDDSTDETSALAAAAVERLRARGLAVAHLRRAHRRGFKAGALAAGLEAARGELIAVFDADFVPPPGFLTATVPSFADPAVGMVQARWEHLNREASLLTRVQALLLDGHFAVEHRARHVAGCFFNFNGTAGIWRRQAIADAGGWAHDTLTEDLDLSYRAQLAGWRFVYLPDVAVPAELPADAASFKAQQRRWAKGSLQTARKVLPRLLAARLPWRVKLEACAHLTANLSYPLMVALSLLLFPAMAARRGSARSLLLWVDAPLFVAATASVFTFYLASQVLLGRRIGRGGAAPARGHGARPRPGAEQRARRALRAAPAGWRLRPHAEAWRRTAARAAPLPRAPRSEPRAGGPPRRLPGAVLRRRLGERHVAGAALPRPLPPRLRRHARLVDRRPAARLTRLLPPPAAVTPASAPGLGCRSRRRTSTGHGLHACARRPVAVAEPKSRAYSRLNCDALAYPTA